MLSVCAGDGRLAICVRAAAVHQTRPQLRLRLIVAGWWPDPIGIIIVYNYTYAEPWLCDIMKDVPPRLPLRLRSHPDCCRGNLPVPIQERICQFKIVLLIPHRSRLHDVIYNKYWNCQMETALLFMARTDSGVFWWGNPCYLSTAAHLDEEQEAACSFYVAWPGLGAEPGRGHNHGHKFPSYGMCVWPVSKVCRNSVHATSAADLRK